MKRSKPNEKHCQCYLYLFQTVYMKLKISNHSSFNLKGTGRNPSGKIDSKGQASKRTDKVTERDRPLFNFIF